MVRSGLPLWRSLLFCPANSDRFIAKAHMRGADGIILDLEDSVPPAEKMQARSGLRAAAAHVATGGSDVLVRINRELPLAVADIQAAVGTNVAALVLPKVRGPEHIQLLSEVVDATEVSAGIELGQTTFLVLVETAAGLKNIDAIATADRRIVAMAVGGEDLATDIDAQPEFDALYVAKMLGIYAARAAGILPIGVLTSVAELTPGPAYLEMLARSRRAGFAGATCVHPSQVSALNETFAPGPAELERARNIVNAFAAAQLRGEGSLVFEGRMVDRPIAQRAQKMIDRFASRSAYSSA